MGDGAADRIVSGAADKATGYGELAALATAGRALGEAVATADRVVDLVVDLIDFWNRARAEPPAAHVKRARELWREIVAADASDLLAPVLIADLGWFSKEAYKLTKQPAIRDLAATGFGAWTNSSKSILVSESLFVGTTQDVQDKLAKVMLRHEANHVTAFLQNHDSPPKTYYEMAVFEADAYTKTLQEVKALAAEDDAFDFAVEGFKVLPPFFADAARLTPGEATEEKILKDMIKEGLLPKTATTPPWSLYLL